MVVSVQRFQLKDEDKEKKPSAMDQVLQGLDIASKIYGISSGVQDSIRKDAADKRAQEEHVATIKASQVKETRESELAPLTKRKAELEIQSAEQKLKSGDLDAAIQGFNKQNLWTNQQDTEELSSGKALPATEKDKGAYKKTLIAINPETREIMAKEDVWRKSPKAEDSPFKTELDSLRASALRQEIEAKKNAPIKKTVSQEDADKKFNETIQAYEDGGGEIGFQQNIAKLKAIRDKLNTGQVVTGGLKNTIAGDNPKVLSTINPALAEVKQNTDSIALESLKQVLKGTMSDKDIEVNSKTWLNPSLSNQANAKIMDEKIAKLEAQQKVINAKREYFRSNNDSLVGYGKGEAKQSAATPKPAAKSSGVDPAVAAKIMEMRAAKQKASAKK